LQRLLPPQSGTPAFRQQPEPVAQQSVCIDERHALQPGGKRTSALCVVNVVATLVFGAGL
jgi:hypothetical protein